MRDLLVVLIVFGSVPYILMRPWIGILMWSWIGYMNPHKLAYGFATTMPLAMIVGITTLFAMIFSKEKKGIPFTREVVVLTLLALHFTLTTIFAWAPDGAWLQWEKVMKILLITYVTSMLIYGKKKIRWLIITIIASIGFFGVKGGVFSILSGGQYKIWGPTGSFLEGNNEMGLAMIMILPIMYFLFRDEENVWIKRILVASIFLTILSIIFTYSRGALVGLFTVSVLLFFNLKHKVRILAVVIPALVIGLSFVPSKLINRAETIKTYEQDHSAMQRIQSWGVAINVAKENPLTGGGFSFVDIPAEKWLSYAMFMGDWNNRPRAAHSVYFQILGQHGVVGLLLFLLLVSMVLLRLKSLKKRFKYDEENQWIFNYASGIQISLIGFLVTGTFLSVAYFDLFYALVILTPILWREARCIEDSSTDSRMHPSFRVKNSTNYAH